MPPAKRAKKASASKSQEQTSPDEQPNLEEGQPSEEQEVNQTPPQEQPSETDQERFDRENREASESEDEDGEEPEEEQRGGRKVGKQQKRGRASWRGRGTEAEDSDELSPYKPKRQPLQAAGLDQHAAEAERQAERDAEREEHNRRTGDASRGQDDSSSDDE